MAPLCKERRHKLIHNYGSLVQRELSAVRLTEGLSVRGSICCIESGLSYPLRLAPLDTSPLSKRGGMVGGCDTSPYHKGRCEVRGEQVQPVVCMSQVLFRAARRLKNKKEGT